MILYVELNPVTGRTNGRVTFWEALFVVWSLGFCLDEFASVKENGVTAYFYSAYNGEPLEVSPALVIQA